jgi:hypothetical protein
MHFKSALVLLLNILVVSSALPVDAAESVEATAIPKKTADLGILDASAEISAPTVWCFDSAECWLVCLPIFHCVNPIPRREQLLTIKNTDGLFWWM